MTRISCSVAKLNIFTPYNDLKSKTYPPAKDKRMQRSNDTVLAM
jgi:hypothetical protein